jgi:hypothetical protein
VKQKCRTENVKPREKIPIFFAFLTQFFVCFRFPCFRNTEKITNVVEKKYISCHFSKEKSRLFFFIFSLRPIYYSGLVSLLSGNLFVFVCSPFTILISLFNFCPCSSTVIFIMNLLVPVCSPFINLRSFSIPPHAPVP